MARTHRERIDALEAVVGILARMNRVLCRHMLEVDPDFADDIARIQEEEHEALSAITALEPPKRQRRRAISTGL